MKRARSDDGEVGQSKRVAKGSYCDSPRRYDETGLKQARRWADEIVKTDKAFYANFREMESSKWKPEHDLQPVVVLGKGRCEVPGEPCFVWVARLAYRGAWNHKPLPKRTVLQVKILHAVLKGILQKYLQASIEWNLEHVGSFVDTETFVLGQIEDNEFVVEDSKMIANAFEEAVKSALPLADLKDEGRDYYKLILKSRFLIQRFVYDQRARVGVAVGCHRDEDNDKDVLRGVLMQSSSTGRDEDTPSYFKKFVE